MILTALVELAEREGLVKNADYQPMPVRWLVTLGPDGQMLGGFRDTQSPPVAKGDRPTVLRFDIPKRSSRTVNSLAEFVVDKPEYVFGWVSPDDLEGADATKEQKLRVRAARRHELYTTEVCLAAVLTRDDGLAALVGFLAQPVPELPTELGTGDLVGFVFDGRLVSARPSVAAYWATRRRQPECGTGKPRATGTPPITAGAGLPCLVTGVVAPPVELHPKPKGIPPAAKTKGGVPLTSVNADAFDSYGLAGVGGAAVSQPAADAYEKALNRLLADGYPDPVDGTPMARRNARLADDTVVVFWSKGDPAAVDLFADAVGQADPAAVEALFSATYKGSPIDLADDRAFYALTLTGGQGRGTVRGWHETTLGDVLRNVRQYFLDIDIAGRDPGRPRPLLGLVACLGVRNKLDNAPSGLAAALFAAVLAGRPFPAEVLAAAVRRTRVEKDETFQRFNEWQRFGLIRGCLVRARRAGGVDSKLPEVAVVVDEACKDRAYLLGRLFAVLEKVQMDAISPNATIRDRYYGAASATPVVVFPQLLRKLPFHLKNASRPVFYEKLVQEIVGGLAAAAFPATLTLEAQGLFAVGYYHESQAVFDKAVNAARKARYHTAEPDPAAPAAAVPPAPTEGA